MKKPSIRSGLTKRLSADTGQLPRGFKPVQPSAAGLFGRRDKEEGDKGNETDR